MKTQNVSKYSTSPRKHSDIAMREFFFVKMSKKYLMVGNL